MEVALFVHGFANVFDAVLTDRVIR